MSRTITFTHDYDWHNQPGGAAHNRRPYSEVVIFDQPISLQLSVFAIVDTGADWLQLPEEALYQLGYTSSGSTPVLDASMCNVPFNIYNGVEVEIEGQSVTLDHVLARPGVPALLGRAAFFTVFEPGFDRTGWLYRF
ncbi:hypothetical protein [Hyphomonas chukchiensis]|uniref:hypothetical protein n=1 Tax=Hyphomonas chukchiensis TaxID=1280947 RepID=UPI0012DDBFE1|nr:hypothetical protein [Hyphomonas chukchiensis]